MPEYSHIQTYIRCNEENFNEGLTKFQMLLSEIGFDDNYIQDNFSNIEWVEEDNGFVYTGCNAEHMKFNYGNFTLNLRPLLLGWTPRISDDIKETWLELELSFETQEIICDYSTGKLRDGIREIIIGYIISFSKYFGEMGVYFTDEVTDGMPWKALIDAGGHVWAFDIAIIPEHLQNFYYDIPKGFSKQDIQGKHLYTRDVV